MKVTSDIFRKIYNTLEQIDVHGHKNITRMNAVMDAMRGVINIIDEAEKEEKGHGNHDEQRKDV